MKRIFSLILIVFALNAGAFAQKKHSDSTKYPSYKGLVMAGYQGWFRAPKDGILYPDENKIKIDM